MLRLIVTFLLAVLLTLGCRPAPLTPVSPAVQATPLLRGELLVPAGYQTQASSGQVKANATVTLIDPATFQAKGSGITAADGTFTVQALGTFTPTLGTLYLLESTKTLGGAGNALFRLRTLVQLTASGWTSVSGTTVQLSTATTAVAILWDLHGLTATDVLGKVSYDATTRTHRVTALNATLGEPTAREVEGLVQDALLRDMDPVQVVRPGPNGGYRLALSNPTRNLMTNSGFEEGGTAVSGWRFYNPAGIGTFSIETGIVYDGTRSVKVTANAAGDLWYGQGGYWDPSEESALTLTTGKTYTVSVYARGAVGGEKLTLSTSAPVTLTTSWQRYTYTFTAATNSRLLILRPGSQAGQVSFPATVYLDDAQLEEGGLTPYEPQGTLLVNGFANAREAVGVTSADGRTGKGVRVDQGLNLISNSSFEVDSNADGIPDGYTTPNGAVTPVLDAGNALFGGKALKIDKPAATPAYVAYPLTYTFKAGTTYTFSVWVKGQSVSGPVDSGNFALYMDGYPVSGGYESFITAAPVGTFDWQRLVITHTFVKDCSSVNVIPIFRNKTGTVWFDGLQVEPGFRATPYAGDGNGGTLDTLGFDAVKSLNAYQGTIAFWYRPAHAWEENNSQIFAVTSGINDNDDCDLSNLPGSNGMPQLRFQIHDGLSWHSGAVWQPPTAPWTAGSWHHLAVTWGARGMELYFDGTKVASDPYPGAILGGQKLRRLLFSGSYNNYAAAANGTLDGLKIWDVQKSATWINRDYLGVSQ